MDFVTSDHWLWNGCGRRRRLNLLMCFAGGEGKISVSASDASKQHSRLKVSTPNRGTNLTAHCQLSMWAGIVVGTASKSLSDPSAVDPPPTHPHSQAVLPWCSWRVVWRLVGSCVFSVPQALIRIQFCLLRLWIPQRSLSPTFQSVPQECTADCWVPQGGQIQPLP